jgi:hypothetical protein
LIYFGSTGNDKLIWYGNFLFTKKLFSCIHCAHCCLLNKGQYFDMTLILPWSWAYKEEYMDHYHWIQ